MSNKNCVILARISSEKQDKEFSLPAQVSRLKEYATRRQMTVLREFVLVESSTVGDRKQFLECIKYCTANHAALIIDTIDRAQRSFMEIPLLEKLRRAGKLEIHFCRENIVVHSKSSASEILMWHQGVMMAEAYSLHFKENVRRSISTKVLRGEYPGRGPLGYINIRTPDNRSDIILDDGRAPLVKQLFIEYSHGNMSLKSLINYAYDIGLRTETGGKLAKSHIHKIITNPFYYGVARWGEYKFEHKYPKLIEKSLWDCCNAILSGKNMHAATRWGSIDYLYRGLIRDYYTNRIITTERKKNKYNYLMAWNAGGRHVAINEDIVTGQIYKILQQIQVPRAAVADVADYLKTAKENEAAFHRRVISELNADLQTAQRRKQNLLNLYLDGKIDDATYSEKDSELRDKCLEIRNKLSAHQYCDDNTNDIIVSIFNATSNVADNFIKSSEVAARRNIIKSIFRTLILRDGTLCYDLNFPFNVLYKNTENNKWRALQDSNLRPAD